MRKVKSEALACTSFRKKNNGIWAPSGDWTAQHTPLVLYEAWPRMRLALHAPTVMAAYRVSPALQRVLHAVKVSCASKWHWVRMLFERWCYIGKLCETRKCLHLSALKLLPHGQFISGNRGASQVMLCRQHTNEGPAVQEIVPFTTGGGVNPFIDIIF